MINGESSMNEKFFIISVDKKICEVFEIYLNFIVFFSID